MEGVFKWICLSLERFDSKDAVNDATIRAQRVTELALVGATMLQELWQVALTRGDLPQLYQLFLAASQPLNQLPTGRVSLALDDVVVPDQVMALELIAEAQGLAWAAHAALAMASGRPVTGVDKLIGARLLAATQPAQSTFRTASDRTTAPQT